MTDIQEMRDNAAAYVRKRLRRRRPEKIPGGLEAEKRGVPALIWDAWEHRDVETKKLLEFMKRHDIIYVPALEWNAAVDGNNMEVIDRITWTEQRLKEFAGLVERYISDDLAKEDIETIASKFAVSVKPTTRQINGKLRVYEYRLYECPNEVDQFLFWLYRSLYDFIIKGKKLRKCHSCGKLFAQEMSGRDAYYCGTACKKRAYRARVKERAAE